MSVFKRVLFFFVLPVLGILFFDPAVLVGGFSLIAVVVVFVLGVGFFQWRGYNRALTFAIFLNGMNVIVRLMLLLSSAFNRNGEFQLATTIFLLGGLLISFFLMLRLDKVDVRLTMNK
ncbi:MAG: hypothetical protein FJZ98_06405 [Chloroflexi bacterium]|nr:hypothetical protein [Chloroflexota bacterium]